MYSTAGVLFMTAGNLLHFLYTYGDTCSGWPDLAPLLARATTGSEAQSDALATASGLPHVQINPLLVPSPRTIKALPDYEAHHGSR